ncbi:hypothetical protein A0O34_14800 [Chryseobacterium glaciei]|uniref:Uncharacterized protein n=1 Tax=Chryseobacterium glaciei TaxID=1685010 RepID=A0A172XXS4_9FLAO|nr:hypothetical protein [Chryseobacterium glaciei]ANF51696.1 hypothetical protein A0O34_14800 [Chryseobacterium glaciei]
MKKTLLLGAFLLAGIVSAFPFRTSCGKVLQVSNSYAQNMSQDGLTDYLTALNGVTCPQHAGSAIITVVYSH